MCGRYSLGKTDRLDWGRFGVKPFPGLVPRWNIAPGTPVLTIRQTDEGLREATALKWGLIPARSQDPTRGGGIVNARAESAHEKPAFRAAFRARRCLLPADGFFEWQTAPGAKRRLPWRVEDADGGVFALGGLWELWRQPGAEPLETCTILTVPANRLLERIHDRMPVIVAPGDYDRWLSPITALDDARALCRPADENTLKVFRVGFAVNTPANDTPEVAQPLDDGRE
jgi:putative SOS response-associated peptidase YedK